MLMGIGERDSQVVRASNCRSIVQGFNPHWCRVISFRKTGARHSTLDMTEKTIYWDTKS